MTLGICSTFKMLIFYVLAFAVAFFLASLIPAIGHEKSFTVTVFPIGFIGLLGPLSIALLYVTIVMRILPVISMVAYIGYALYAAVGIRSKIAGHFIGFIAFLILDLIGLILMCTFKD